MKSGYRTLILLSLAVTVAAARPDVAPAQSAEGFLFQRPTVVLGVHGGFTRPDAESEIFAFVTDLLTLGHSDFYGVAAGSSAYLPLSDRLGVELSGTYTGRVSGSEFREWVDDEDLPIEQRTQFVRVPILAGGRLYLVPQGRKIGSFVWIPARVAPYLGAGAGMVWHRFRQVGDFVDFQDLGIFYDELDSQGWTPAGHVSAGVDVTLSPRLSLTTRAEYLRARSRMGRDFVDFDRIDLSGFNATVGISMRL